MCLECNFVQQCSEKVVVFVAKCKNIEESFPYILIYGIFFVFFRLKCWRACKHILARTMMTNMKGLENNKSTWALCLSIVAIVLCLSFFVLWAFEVMRRIRVDNDSSGVKCKKNSSGTEMCRCYF